MTQDQIHDIVLKQREFFRTGTTLDVDYRIEQLQKLKKAVIKHKKSLTKALQEDLGKSRVESYLCDIGPTIVEINEMLHGIKKWSKPERHYSGMMCFPSTSTKVYKMPYGVTLIISPFNFPVYLTLGVLAASISAENTAVIKTSSKSKESTKALKKMIEETFDEKFITLIDGGHDVADYCLEERFDKIFYTGSPEIGKHVMEKASKNLTPVALELGGETGNWCIIRKDANLKDAARKIAFFKLCNAGQICININQIAIAEEVADKFLEYLKKEFERQIGDSLTNPEYPKLITEAAYDKCVTWTEKYKDRIIFGGNGNKENLRFSPTILYPVNMDEDIVQHELFCPILPVVGFKDDQIDMVLDTISKREHPLSMYIFTRNIKWANKVMSTSQYGGGCINEVCIHMMVKGVPFNGVGHSGMGAYHGKWGFDEFTHPQTVLKGRTIGNLSLREHPYSDIKLKLLEIFER